MKKPRYKKMPSKSVAKALKTRGGISAITPLQASGVKKFVTSKLLKVGRDAGMRVLKGGYSPKAALAAALMEEIPVKLRNGEWITNVAAPFTGGTRTSPKQRSVPAVYSNPIGRTTNLPMGLMGQAKQSYKTNFETGNPTSKTLLELGREQGTRKEVLFDSKFFGSQPFGEGGSGDPILRRYLLNGHGFNTRCFAVLPEVASVSRAQLQKISVLANANFGTNNISPLNEDQTIYASLMYTKTRIELINQNRFFPINFKIHVVLKNGESFAPLNGETPITNLPTAMNAYAVQQVLETPIDPSGEIEGTEQVSPSNYQSIPSWFLVNSGSQKGSDELAVFSWEQLRSGRGFMASPWCRQNLTVVKTFTKKLEVGETWKFQHQHNFGGGFDMTRDFRQPIDATKSMSATYNYIIESSGYPCEGIQNSIDDGTAKVPRLGTSPGKWFYDFQTEVKYVQAADRSNLVRLGNKTGPGFLEAPATPAMHIRVFDNDKAGYLNFLKLKPYYKELPFINNVPTNVPGDFYIPVEADTAIMTDGAGTIGDTGFGELPGYGFKIG